MGAELKQGAEKKKKEYTSSQGLDIGKTGKNLNGTRWEKKKKKEE